MTCPCFIVILKGSCSTVTVDKCKAGLKTLQAFPYFRPTCLCREPHLDPKCNEYRNFFFDHPCMYVQKQGESWRFLLLFVLKMFYSRLFRESNFPAHVVVNFHDLSC